MFAVRFRETAREQLARAGVATTHRGEYETPCFMPVGTRGAIRHLSSQDYEQLGARIVLGNTYHLMLRPGAQVVSDMGGLGEFAGWKGLTLTDSGGFQVFSLSPDVDDDGVSFRSTYDGSMHRFTPESAVRTQQLLGADIQMVLDVCPPLPSTDEVIKLALKRTSNWAARAKATHTRADQSLFGIVQGGIDPVLRQESAKITANLEFDGYGIGGLSVGETREEMLVALAAAIEHLPHDRPRYLMGVGDPASLVEAVNLGVDQFDCVMQTRIGRHGTALTSSGKLNITRAEFSTSQDPIDLQCVCPVCQRHTRGYIRHLFQVNEPTAARLVSMHNIAFTLNLMQQMRDAIAKGEFASLRKSLLAVWAGSANEKA
ncbi:MAG: tRNA guanosine(34) transglycosylase Tgt [Actinomycetota bacterium]|nr:tRNA guanosine(34) transglycosylase Tgt [Actinomycetota bacterium]MDA3003485.1 tRNA guanosine(34) transglycosylase Tgt [Actinomycetota bacterium]